MNQNHSTLQKPVSVAVVVRGGVVQSTHANVPGVGVTVYEGSFAGEGEILR